ncbi:sphingomyelin phosphodiesterase [Plasmodium cynomolgi strain B]|uniref:Sphingomyelin phosphodiesterase n=1 Tax=Plasmodium cynomolgi (strain B) TaxID=1120755 RepID=K6UZ47_PLACD|nr:sphingomyelin phosphodiesterase [Plasmodium cynomolgi strain B]GAB69214.1 sphingomyelin phosphodiesterase [Plasmodium cynomolgi strain B]
MDNLNALTDTTLTIMSYNVQMIPVPLSNQLNLSTRQDAVIDYICSLDDLHNIDILVLNEVFTSKCYDVLTKGKVKDKFPYHTNVIGTKCEVSGECSSSIVQIKKDARAGTSTNGKTSKKKATGGKAPAPSDLNRKIVRTKTAPPKAAPSKTAPSKAAPPKAAPPKAAPSKVTTLRVATSREATPRATTARGEEASTLSSSDTNNNDQEEVEETLNLDSSDTSNMGDSECILSFNCGPERGDKIKGKRSSQNYKAVANSKGKRNGKRNGRRSGGGDDDTKTDSISSDKKAQYSETDDGMEIPEKRQYLRVNSRGAAGVDKLKDKSYNLRSNQLNSQRSDKAGSSKRVTKTSSSAKGASKKDGPGKDPNENVDGCTKESRSRRNTTDLENSNGDGKVSTQSSYRSVGEMSTQSSYGADDKVNTQSSYGADDKVNTPSSNNAEGALTNTICDIASEVKGSIPNNVSSAENLKEKKCEGVIVLSKHAFIHKHALIYNNCKFPDMFCKKGAIYLKCNINNKAVNVIATHLQAGDTREQQNCRWKQLKELSNWVYNGTPSLHIKKNEPLFFVGDFNIRYHIDKSFFDKVLSSGCLNSSVTKKALDTTYDSYLNDYCMHMEHDYSFKYNYTLDYILVNNDSDVKTLVPQTAIQKDYRPIQIIKSLLGFIPYKYTYIHHPSDHFPIYATFKIPD